MASKEELELQSILDGCKDNIIIKIVKGLFLMDDEKYEEPPVPMGIAERHELLRALPMSSLFDTLIKMCILRH